MERDPSNRIPVSELLTIGARVCQLAGENLERCWVHGSHSPRGRRDPRPDSEVDLHLLTRRIKTLYRSGQAYPLPELVWRFHVVRLIIGGRMVNVSYSRRETPFRPGSRSVINLGHLARTGPAARRHD